MVKEAPADGRLLRSDGKQVTGTRQPIWLRISMDRISDSDSEDAGSIPAGATNEADIKRQAGLEPAFLF